MKQSEIARRAGLVQTEGRRGQGRRDCGRRAKGANNTIGVRIGIYRWRQRSGLRSRVTEGMQEQSVTRLRVARLDDTRTGNLLVALEGDDASRPPARALERSPSVTKTTSQRDCWCFAQNSTAMPVLGPTRSLPSPPKNASLLREWWLLASSNATGATVDSWGRDPPAPRAHDIFHFTAPHKG